MAKRPFYAPNLKKNGNLVIEDYVDFQFYTGFSISQKQKSINSFHESIKNYIGFSTNILEISSKSTNQIGIKLSAFNLELEIKNGIKSSVESIFQGSKVFEHGGPFNTLYNEKPMYAKKFEKLKTSGTLQYFNLQGDIWELEPKTAFYDWLYLNALKQNQNLAIEILNYDVFTDIEFNPQKSVSNQAKSAALYYCLKKNGLLEEALRSKEEFLKILKQRTIENKLF